MENIVASVNASSPPLALLVVAIAPTVVLLSYLYIRDRYEKEPLGLLARAFLFGCLSVLPVIVVEIQLTGLNRFSGLGSTAFDAFIAAGLTEELFKLGAVYLAVYRSPHFNEPYDGVLYAASASLGFATVENIGYVLSHGLETGLSRAVLAVPGHALWGIAMGFYMGSAKFAHPKRRSGLWLMSFLIPWLFHGSYDLIAYNMNTVFSILMYPLVAYLWVTGLRQIDRASAASPFRLLGTLGKPIARPMSAGGEGYAQASPSGSGSRFPHTGDDCLDDDQSNAGGEDLHLPPGSLRGVQVEREIQPCPACSGLVRVGAEVCVHCGLPLSVCQSCHSPIPAATKFCVKCGVMVR